MQRWFLVLVSWLVFAVSAYADLPLWAKRRNLAMSFFRPDSPVSFSIGRELYQQGAEHNFYPRDFVSWQTAQVTDPFFYFQNDCLILVGMPPERCLRFNVNLNLASTFYLGWIFAQGYAQDFLYRLAQQHLRHLNEADQWMFLKNLPHFVEADQYVQVYAMLWWKEMVANWPLISQRISGVGHPEDHDYALDLEHAPYSDVARNNLASLNEFQRKFSTADSFLNYVHARFRKVNPQAQSWEHFRHNRRYAGMLEVLEQHWAALVGRIP